MGQGGVRASVREELTKQGDTEWGPMVSQRQGQRVTGWRKGTGQGLLSVSVTEGVVATSVTSRCFV
jgi:hypothetical protein